MCNSQKKHGFGILWREGGRPVCCCQPGSHHLDRIFERMKKKFKQQAKADARAKARDQQPAFKDQLLEISRPAPAAATAAPAVAIPAAATAAPAVAIPAAATVAPAVVIPAAATAAPAVAIPTVAPASSRAVAIPKVVAPPPAPESDEPPLSELQRNVDSITSTMHAAADVEDYTLALELKARVSPMRFRLAERRIQRTVPGAAAQAEPASATSAAPAKPVPAEAPVPAKPLPGITEAVAPVSEAAQSRSADAAPTAATVDELMERMANGLLLSTKEMELLERMMDDDDSEAADGAAAGSSSADLDLEMDYETMRAVFARFDADQSGFVNVAEMAAMCKELGIEKTVSEVAQLIKDADPNGGRLSYPYRRTHQPWAHVGPHARQPWAPCDAHAHQPSNFRVNILSQGAATWSLRSSWPC